MDNPGEKIHIEAKNKILAGVAYLFNFLGFIGVIFVIIFYFLTQNKFARLHLLQSIFFNLVLGFLFLMFPIVSFWNYALPIVSFWNYALPIVSFWNYALPIVSFWNYALPIVMILLAFYAFLGEGFEIPFIKKFVYG